MLVKVALAQREYGLYKVKQNINTVSSYLLRNIYCGMNKL